MIAHLIGVLVTWHLHGYWFASVHGHVLHIGTGHAGRGIGVRYGHHRRHHGPSCRGGSWIPGRGCIPN